MTEKPKVLVFDDDLKWIKLIEQRLSRKCNVTSISDSKHWNIQVSGSKWEAIIIDVKILGESLNWPERAKQSILEYLITSPIIVVSEVFKPDALKIKYGEIFFGYIGKEDGIEDELMPMIESACTNEGKNNHIKKMTTEFAKEYKILEYEFPRDWISNRVILELINTDNKKTIKDLISTTFGNQNEQLTTMGKIILDVITMARDQKEND